MKYENKNKRPALQELNQKDPNVLNIQKKTIHKRKHSSKKVIRH